MSVFASPVRHKPWLTQITILSTIMGGLLALSLKTQDRIRSEQMPSMRPNKIAAAYAEMRDENGDLRKQVAQLRKQVQKYQDAMSNDSGKTKVMAEDLKKLNILAGLVAVEGPGVVVTLRDSKRQLTKPVGISDEEWISLTQPYIIHDHHIRDIINELKNAGAEAIAVNDQRVTNNSSIRCIGNVVQVNGVPTAGSPVTIKAIGNADLMQSGLLMPRGVMEEFRMTDPAMFSVDKVKNMTLPAFSGATPIQFAVPAVDAKADQAQQQSEAAAKATSETALTGGKR